MNNASEEKSGSFEQVFRVLWAMAIIFHQSSSVEFPLQVLGNGLNWRTSFNALVNVVSLIVIAKPSKNFSFALLLFAFVAKTAYDLPFISNHTQLLALSSSAIFISLILSRPLPIVSLRWTTITVYFFVTLHKLNEGFFSSASCANYYGAGVLGSFLPASAVEILVNCIPLMVVCTEATLTALLLIPRFTFLGVVLGYALHFSLGLDLERRFFNFSALMFALLFLFQSENFIENILQRKNKNKLLSLIVFYFGSAAFRTSIALMMLALQFGLHPDLSTTIRLNSFIVIISIWFVISLALTWIMVLYSRPSTTCSNSPSLPSLNDIWLPLLVAVISLGPYLGFRTKLSLDMYSNLIVEDGHSNHFFLPSLDLWGILKDSVQIIESSDSILTDEYRDKNLKMVGLEFDRYLLSHPGITVKYLRGSNSPYLVNSDDKPAASSVSLKLLSFRPIQELNGSICLW